VAGEVRVHDDGVAGALSADLAVGALTMSSAGLIDLRVVNVGEALALSIYRRDGNGRVTRRECVWVLEHTLNNPVATVSRGQEGTSDLQWAEGDRWEHAVTAIDIPGVTDFAVNPTPGVARTAVVTAGITQVSAVEMTWVGTHLFRGVRSDGAVADFAGTIDAAGAAGSKYLCPLVITAIGGTNGVRGDSIVSDTANGVGATSFNGYYASTVFADKGSLNLYVAFGTLSAYSGGGSVYAELAAFVGSMINNRTGALVEGFEAAVNSGSVGSPVQGRNSGFTAVMNEFNTTLTYWSRGFWAASGGSQLAGDALYVGGAGGWRNFLHCTHTDATDRFRVDATGKLYIGVGARALYDDGANLHADGTFVAGSLFSGGNVFGAGYFLASDATRGLQWAALDPAGVVVAGRGAIFGNTAGAAGTCLSVKESDTNTVGWKHVLTSSGFALDDAADVAFGTTTGTKIGTSSTQKIGLWNATPVIQPSAYTQTFATADKVHAARTATAVTTTAATQTTPWGFSTQAQADAIVTQLNNLRNDHLDTAALLNSVVDDLQAIGAVG
jgi:hypothetical protein